ncbi:MAG: hypothetical protein ACP5H8_01325 [Candidatus Micrarchaeia archaeon]
MGKLKIGWITFTCSEDSTVLFLELLNKNFFDWTERIDFVYFKALRKGVDLHDIHDVDVFFVEGAISTDKEEEELRYIRKISKYVVAVGSCACTGMPSAQRNVFSEPIKNMIKERIYRYGLHSNVEPINKFVKVDDYIMGCPMVEANFIKVLGKYLDMFNTGT